MPNILSDRAKTWWRGFRYLFVSPSIFPAALGGLVSWVHGTFYPLLFLVVMVAIVVNHVGLNMTDDYFDYKHSVDRLKPGEKNPYTGGSGTLSSGEIKPQSMLHAFVVCYLITIAAGIFLTFQRGLPVLAFGLFGVFCAIFYTAPPISLSHHGLGELALLVNFGSIIGLGAYFVEAQTLAIEAFLATLPMGIMLFSMIVINEIPDIEEDRRAGKLTLVARYGRKTGVKLYVASWLCTVGVIVGGVVSGFLPIFCLVALFSLPLVYRSAKTLQLYHQDAMLLAPANLNMIRAHSVACWGLIVGYAVQGIFNGADTWQLVFALLLLAVVYAPIAWSLTRNRH